MYIYCCTTNLAEDELYLKMCAKKVKILPLALLKLEINEAQMKYITINLNKYNIIILNSPTSITLCAQLLVETGLIYSGCIICVMGRASKNLLVKELARYMPASRVTLINKNIKFPLNASGSIALCDEILSTIDFTAKRLLFIKGSQGNNILECWLDDHRVEYKVVSIYSQVKLTIIAAKLREILTNCIQAIVITSGLMVEYLFENATKYRLLHILKQQRFLTIHQQIAIKLESLGVNKELITVTKEADKNLLLELL